MSTASKFAKSIAKRMLVAKAQGTFDQEYSNALERVAAEADETLTPVRKCLEGLRFRHGCWCELPPNASSPDHTSDCEAAQQLYERLKIQ